MLCVILAGGSGGKGTWGGLLDTAGDLQVDRKDPNYDSEEVNVFLSVLSLCLAKFVNTFKSISSVLKRFLVSHIVDKGGSCLTQTMCTCIFQYGQR